MKLVAIESPLCPVERHSECRNCYAERISHKGRWNGTIKLVPEKLDEPLRWRKPRRVFVNSMSDLFHPGVPDEYIAAVFGVMAACPQQHTFQVLTKRPERMREWFRWAGQEGQGRGIDGSRIAAHGWPPELLFCLSWPLPNVWLGVSVEDQATADARVPLLLQCPAAVRFVSYEPALGPVGLWAIKDGSWYDSEGATRYNSLTGTAWWAGTGDHGLGGGPALDWVIVGGESGPGARPCNVGWIRSVVRQCRHAAVPCFVKQLGASVVPASIPATGGGVINQPAGTLRHPKGGDPDEWPEDLRVREFPT